MEAHLQTSAASVTWSGSLTSSGAMYGSVPLQMTESLRSKSQAFLVMKAAAIICNTVITYLTKRQQAKCHHSGILLR